MTRFDVTGEVKRFPGKGGWYYVELGDKLSADLRPAVASTWPALLPCQLRLGDSSWKSSIMPIKDGPLFIALPAKVRKAETIMENQVVTVSCEVSL